MVGLHYILKYVTIVSWGQYHLKLIMGTANSKAGKFLKLKLCVNLLNLIEFHQKKQYFSSNPDFEKPVGT